MLLLVVIAAVAVAGAAKGVAVFVARARFARGFADGLSASHGTPRLRVRVKAWTDTSYDKGFRSGLHAQLRSRDLVS